MEAGEAISHPARCAASRLTPGRCTLLRFKSLKEELRSALFANGHRKIALSLPELPPFAIDKGKRLGRFLTVGASGLFVNNLLLFVLTEAFGIHYLLSAALGTQGSTLWNFALTEKWVFGDRDVQASVRPRFLRYFLMNNTSLILRGPLLSLMVSALGLHYVPANLISLFAMTLLRYLLSDRWIWSGGFGGRGGGTEPFAYDIHGIVTVESQVRLPELEYFRVDRLDAPPDIRCGEPSLKHSDDPEPTEAISYEDGLGRYGFQVTISRGERTRVSASPLIRRSPHVLYTNVIEPILRWTFVRKGYALIHGACVAFGDQAALITARTDTGKTTTVLRAIDSQPWAFLADDMTIVGPDGQVYSYPKPLTISLHTLRAVEGAALRPRERAALQIQSRVHSRDGRRLAMLMSRLGIPAASLNALVQKLIPPPKYMLDRLIPSVTMTDRSVLSHVILIERGPESEEALRSDQIVDELIRNAEDAYGFPPYPALAAFLSRWNGDDLQDLEREIIRKATEGRQATRLLSQEYRWWQRLPALLWKRPVKAGLNQASGVPASPSGEYTQSV